METIKKGGGGGEKPSFVEVVISCQDGLSGLPWGLAGPPASIVCVMCSGKYRGLGSMGNALLLLVYRRCSFVRSAPGHQAGN